MSETRQVPQEVIFEGKTIEVSQIKKALDTFFANHETDLSKDHTERLRSWFTHEVARHVRREAKTKNIPKSEFVSSALTYFLGRLEERVRIAVEEPRLCPELASKVSLKREFIARLKEGKTIILVNIDLDGFKGINDAYGHLAGDKVLRNVGTALGAAIRPTDVAAHYSGDEFGLFLPLEETGQPPENISEVAAAIVSRIVSNLKNNVSRPDNTTQEMSVGFSITKATADQDAMAAFESAYAAADKASELSKIIGLMPKTEAGAVPSEERIVFSEKISETEKDINPQELRQARVMRALKRALGESYGNISTADLNPIINTFFKSLETALTDKDGQ